jgi:hypothetical protein
LPLQPYFSQTLRQTNEGNSPDPNDPHQDQAIPHLPNFRHHLKITPLAITLERDFPLIQIINYSNSINNSYGLTYDT